LPKFKGEEPTIVHNIYWRLIMKKLLLAVLSSLLLSTPTSSQTPTKGKVLVIVSSADAIDLRDGKLVD
jgi:hypothetical protein